MCLAEIKQRIIILLSLQIQTGLKDESHIYVMASKLFQTAKFEKKILSPETFVTPSWGHGMMI